MEMTDVEAKTKKIYVEQHKAYLKDKSIFDRFYDVAVNPYNYCVSADFFKGKNVLDAGCGNTAYFQKAMYDLGCNSITCLDLGDEWQPILDDALKNLEVPENFYSLVSGSVTELPFNDGEFDFVCSNGVIMHLDGIDMAEKAVREMMRVTKKGGSFYIYVGMQEPGVVDKYIVPSLRLAYQEDLQFRALIDTLSPSKIVELFSEITPSIATHDPEILNSYNSIIKYITLDTCTFLQNMLQVPIQQGARLSYNWITGIMRDEGFTNIRKVPNTYWKRNDVRRFLAPIHFSESSVIKNIFYGGGHLKVIADKL